MRARESGSYEPPLVLSLDTLSRESSQWDAAILTVKTLRAESHERVKSWRSTLLGSCFVFCANYGNHLIVDLPRG